MGAHLSIRPVRHLRQREVGAVDARGAPPHGQAQQDHEQPEGEEDMEAAAGVGRLLGGRLGRGRGRGRLGRGAGGPRGACHGEGRWEGGGFPGRGAVYIGVEGGGEVVGAGSLQGGRPISSWPVAVASRVARYHVMWSLRPCPIGRGRYSRGAPVWRARCRTCACRGFRRHRRAPSGLLVSRPSGGLIIPSPLPVEAPRNDALFGIQLQCPSDMTGGNSRVPSRLAWNGKPPTPSFP